MWRSVQMCFMHLVEGVIALVFLYKLLCSRLQSKWSEQERGTSIVLSCFVKSGYQGMCKFSCTGSIHILSWTTPKCTTILQGLKLTFSPTGFNFSLLVWNSQVKMKTYNLELKESIRLQISDLHDSFLTQCRIKFVKIMVIRVGWATMGKSIHCIYMILYCKNIWKSFQELECQFQSKLV
jgi:hypothetical protein